MEPVEPYAYFEPLFVNPVSEEPTKYIDKYNQWYRRTYDHVYKPILIDPYPISNFDWNLYSNGLDTMQFPFVQLPSEGSNIPRERDFAIPQNRSEDYNRLFSEYTKTYNSFLDLELQNQENNGYQMDETEQIESVMQQTLNTMDHVIQQSQIPAIVHDDQTMKNYDSLLIKFKPSSDRTYIEAIFQSKVNPSISVVVNARNGCILEDCVTMEEYIGLKSQENSPFKNHEPLPHESLCRYYMLKTRSL